MARPKSLRGEIAEALELSPSRVSHYWKKGMPRDSVEEATKWHALNVGKNTHAGKKVPKKKAATKKKASTKEPPAIDRFVESLGDDGNLDDEPGLVANVISGEGLSIAIREIERDLKYIQGMLKKSKGDLALERYYRDAHTTRVEQLRKIEVVWQKIQKEKEQSVSIEDLGEVLNELFRDFRRRLDNAARRIASMVPPEAAPIVEKAADKEMRTMMTKLHECEYLPSGA
jgi:hypothetical protein